MTKNRGPYSIGSRLIPLEINFDDVLAVFYNFRNNAYGKIRKGANQTIYTVPEKESDKIDINIMDQEEQYNFMAKNN